MSRAFAALLLLHAVALSGTVYLNILHTNDIHGGIAAGQAAFMNPDFPPGIGGGAWIASYVESVRRHCEQEGEFVLLIDAGDFWQGTPVGNHNSGEFVIQWMNAMEYDMATIGNHEFDHGALTMIDVISGADFPIICTNVFTGEGHIPHPMEPWITMDIGGVSAGFIGVTTPDTYGLVDPELLDGFTIGPELQAVEEAVSELREQGVQLIVLLSHLGHPPDSEVYTARVFSAWERGEEFTKDFALNTAELTCLVEGIDLVVSGHTHVGFREPWVNPMNHTIVVQGYANGTGIGHIRLALDTETGTVTGYDLPGGEALISLLHDRFWPDQEHLELIEGFRAIAEEGMDTVLGEAVAEIPRGTAEHPLGRLMCDGIRAVTGADVALLNRGGIRAAIPRGPITPRIIYTSIPFEEDLFLLDLTGAQLLDVLETGMQGRRRDMQISGFTCNRNQLNPDGSKIENPLVNGVPLDPLATYTLVTTGYLAQGNVGYGIMLEHQPRYAGVSLLEAVSRHIEAVSPIAPDNTVRIVWIEEER